MSTQFNKLQKAIKKTQTLQKIAKEFGFSDIFESNNLRTLQSIIICNMRVVPGYHGNDAIDSLGREWELKSSRIDSSCSSISIASPMSKAIINRLKNVYLLVSYFEGQIVKEIYALTPAMLRDKIAKWEENLPRAARLDNSFIKKGILVYTSADGLLKKIPEIL